METLENQITVETLNHLIINAIKEIGYSKKDTQMKHPFLSTLTKLFRIKQTIHRN